MVIFTFLNVLGNVSLFLSYLKLKSGQSATSSVISTLSAMEHFPHNIICLVKLLNVGSFFLMKFSFWLTSKFGYDHMVFFSSYSKTLANNKRTLPDGVGGLSHSITIFFPSSRLLLPVASQSSRFQILCCFGERIPKEMLQTLPVRLYAYFFKLSLIFGFAPESLCLICGMMTLHHYRLAKIGLNFSKIPFFA